ncbi:YhdP family protein [Chitinimonas sp. BJB300]|uniref:YhdP family protein n=1 Tax=Chitinimonas sp. BJB300 TaxID=1559339 RepID=UPI000C0E5A36|nr:YhdP family protein [Chitinimonas sp. BJB300]PHV12391.1 TIGR02099 family protein [Chitinimonas sp. BJB300]TSJ88987.1 TIGR02099 family protein [Chitinimonas sp. BJB300]
MPTPHPHFLRARFVLLRRLVLRLLHLHFRGLIWLFGGLLLLWLGAAAWLQWWFFPHLESYRPALVEEFSRRVGRPVGVDAIQGGWHKGKPYLDMQGLSLRSAEGVVALSLPRVEATLSWWPLLLGQLRFERLAIMEPDLTLSRDEGGTIRLAGLALNTGDDDSLTNWVLRQHEIAIVNGRLRWQDAVRGAPELQLKQLNITLENLLFGRHRVQFLAAPPDYLAAPISLDVQWRGDDLANWANWHGSAQARLDRINLSDWSRWLPYPAEVASGSGELRANLDFAGSTLNMLDGRFRLQGARTRLAPDLAVLDIRQLEGRATWRSTAKARTLHLQGLKLELGQKHQLNGAEATLSFFTRGGGQLDITGLTLTGLGALAESLPLSPVWRTRLAGVEPSGRIDRLSASWQGAWPMPTTYAGQMAFTGLGLNAPAPWPSASALDGDLTFNQQGGHLALRGNYAQLNAGELFTAPLQFDNLRLAVDWARMDRGVSVYLRDFVAKNADLDANATAEWTWPGEGLGVLRLDAKVAHVRANAVADYLPTVLGEDTLAWLKSSLVAGEARNAQFTLHGPLAQFPFADGHSGIWKMETEADGVKLAYASGWPSVDNLDGKVSIVGNRLEVAAKGKILGTEARSVKALIPDLAQSTAVVIDGAVNGPTAEFFRFIAQSPLDQILGGVGSSAQAAGVGKLDLKLTIPFQDAANTQVTGTYQFDNNELRIGASMPPLRALNGKLQFNAAGIQAEGLLANTLGGALRADISNAADGTMQITANGRADLREVAAMYGLPQPERLSGSSAYHAVVRLPKDGLQLQVDAPLTEAKLDLPAPLGKPSGETRALKLQLNSSKQEERWRLNLGTLVNAELLRTGVLNNLQLTRGDIRIGGGAPTMANPGLWLTLNLPEFDIDPWLQMQAQAGLGKSENNTWPALAGVEVQLGKLQISGKQLEDLTLRAVPQVDTSWQVTAASRQVEGRLSWSSQERGRVFARLSRLQMPLPDGPNVTVKAADSKASATKLPAIDLIAEDFLFHKNSLGRLVLQAQQQRENWQIDSLSLINPDGRLNASGVWRYQGADSNTRVKLVIESDNLGKLLGRFGYPETIQRGRGKLSGEVSWNGAPTSLDYPSLGGMLKLQANSGQFAKIEPGVGRLLGILSLQSLPRRLSLDFRDVFSEGFSFDRIEGDSKIVRGVMTTDNLVIVGPAAQVLFRGEADVAHETQKLRVRIVPVLGDSIAVSVGLVNPLAAVGAFLLQRVLKDPLGRLIAYEYDITGTWSDPQIKRTALPLKNLPTMGKERSGTGK